MNEWVLIGGGLVVLVVLLGGVGLVERHIALDVVKIAPGAGRPDYLNHDLGGGTRLPVPQVLSQAATSS